MAFWGTGEPILDHGDLVSQPVIRRTDGISRPINERLEGPCRRLKLRFASLRGHRFVPILVLWARELLRLALQHRQMLQLMNLNTPEFSFVLVRTAVQVSY